MLSQIKTAALAGFRSALKTAWWMIRLTVIISLAVTLLQHFGVIPLISSWFTPVFKLVGLDGRAALVFITGALVNIYAAIATIVSMGFDSRSITILALMCLCAHNLIIETAIQKKTGSPAIRMVVVRIATALTSAFILNAVLPPAHENYIANAVGFAPFPNIADTLAFWALSTLMLVVKMFCIIVSLTVAQRILSDLGAIRWISTLLHPLMALFGLPRPTSFLWIVTQTLGLAYGAAVMIEERESGRVTKQEADLLNHHVAVSHSNVEDLLLFFSIGASLFWMLFLRIILTIPVVWERRLEIWIHSKQNLTKVKI
ncbi:MAG: nucleoside recognition domain-containing protein [Prevotellaceae bacterium]|jgi:spore maturation protein SpmB|nr:nucleoside recognition domain-containing protein [Prevotellaceae bacterium]